MSSAPREAIPIVPWRPLKSEGKSVSSSWAQDARNRLSLSLEVNLKIPEVREIFLGLVKNSDVWLENLVWIEKLGITDEMCLAVNPKLIIVHVSGFGRPQFGGLPEMCDRGSYDMIGQAASGWISLMVFANQPLSLAKHVVMALSKPCTQ